MKISYFFSDMDSTAYKSEKCSCRCLQGALSNWKTADRCKGCSCRPVECAGCFNDGLVVIDKDPDTGERRVRKVVFDESSESFHVRLSSDGSLPGVDEPGPRRLCRWARRFCCRIKLVTYNKGKTIVLDNLYKYEFTHCSVAQ